MEFTVTLTLGQLFVGTGVVLGAVGVGWKLYFSSLLNRLQAQEDSLATLAKSIDKRINNLQIAANSKTKEQLNPLIDVIETLDSTVKLMQEKVHGLDKDVSILQDRQER